MAAKTCAEKLAAGTITADGLKPMAIPEPVYTPSQFIAGERYLLRKFNYQGDMLIHITEKAPADVKEMEKLFKGLKVQQKSTPPGKPWTAWIGAADDNVRVFRRTGLNPGMLPTSPGMDPAMNRMITHIMALWVLKLWLELEWLSLEGRRNRQALSRGRNGDGYDEASANKRIEAHSLEKRADECTDTPIAIQNSNTILLNTWSSPSRFSQTILRGL